MGTLVMLHCKVNTGYAIAALERAFFAAARAVEQDPSTVHFSYKRMEEDRSHQLPERFDNYLTFDLAACTRRDRKRLAAYVRQHGIRRALAVDLSVGHPAIGALRSGGVQRLVSYYGAPVSSINRGLTLWAKRIEVALRRKADHFVFESEAMRRSAVEGRGIPAQRTSIVHLATDQELFHPEGPRVDRAELGIPDDRLLVIFTGHMEPRKGVAVLVKGMIHLVDELDDRRFHLLACGNRGDQAKPYIELLQGTRARKHVTFGGYRDDIPQLMRTADVGAIASTGWDSFTQSAVEMASSGLPMVVSRLQGLAETVVHGETGFLFTPGAHEELARNLRRLAEDPELMRRLGENARRRAESRFSREAQVQGLTRVLRGTE